MQKIFLKESIGPKFFLKVQAKKTRQMKVINFMDFLKRQIIKSFANFSLKLFRNFLREIDFHQSLF